MSVAFDWSIKLGDVLTIVAIVAAALGFLYTLRGKVDAMDGRLKHVETELSAFVQALVQLARQDERLNSHDKRLSSIEAARAQSANRNPT